MEPEEASKKPNRSLYDRPYVGNSYIDTSREMPPFRPEEDDFYPDIQKGRPRKAEKDFDGKSNRETNGTA